MAGLEATRKLQAPRSRQLGEDLHPHAHTVIFTVPWCPASQSPFLPLNLEFLESIIFGTDISVYIYLKGLRCSLVVYRSGLVSGRTWVQISWLAEKSYHLWALLQSPKPQLLHRSDFFVGLISLIIIMTCVPSVQKTSSCHKCLLLFFPSPGPREAQPE